MWKLSKSKVFLYKEKFFFLLYLYEMMNVHWIYCGNYFLMYVSQMIMLFTLTLYSAICQLYLNKTGKKEKKKAEILEPVF